MDYTEHPFHNEAPDVIYVTTSVVVREEVFDITYWENVGEDEGEERPSETYPWQHTEYFNAHDDDHINFHDTSQSDSNSEQIVYVSLDTACDHGMRLTPDTCNLLSIPPRYTRRSSPQPTLQPDQPGATKSDIENLKAIYQAYKEFVVVEPLCQAIESLIERTLNPVYQLPPFTYSRASAAAAINTLLCFGPQAPSPTPPYAKQIDSLMTCQVTAQGWDFWSEENARLSKGGRLSQKAFEILSSWARQLSTISTPEP